MNWSIEQKAIFDWYAQEDGNVVVEALAGTGKTTTIKESFTYCHPDVSRILYAVFNKRNQKEAQVKITEKRVDVKTLHALGYSYILKVWPGVKADNNVEYDRIMKQAPFAGKEEVGLTAKLVGLLKNTGINATASDACKICQDYDLDFGDRQDRWITVALASMQAAKIKDPAGRISFDDMVWLPVACSWVKPIYDLVTIDEAQDMNLPQLTMARQACKPNGRIAVVGDSRQAIYGFRGAVQNGMGMMKTILNAKTLSLTTTYRCPKEVVAQAAKYVPAYKAADSAPEGKVATINQAGLAQTVAVGDAILSRLNAPLMPLTLSLLRRNIPARIEGKDIGKQLIGMIKSLKARSIPELLEKITKWREKQTARLQPVKNSEKRIEQVSDIAETLQAISEGASSVTDAEIRLQNIFQDTDETSKPAVVLSSVHKAKGLEWKRVFLLSETFRAGRGGEEENIYYVALTRSMSELYFVGSAGISPPVLQSQPISGPGASIKASSQPPGPRIDSTKVYEAKVLYDTLEENILPGCRERIPGEIVWINHVPWVVDYISPGSAVIKSITGSRTDRISRQCDSIEEPAMDTNFVSSKSKAEADKQNKLDTKQNNETETNMNTLTDIETFVLKAIQNGKDDNKIVAACMGKTFENAYDAVAVVKTIAKMRKVHAKGVPAAAVPVPKGKAPAPKAKSAKAASSPRLSEPTPEHPWSGLGAFMREQIAKGVDAETVCKKATKTWRKMSNSTFAADWLRFTGKKVTVTSAKPDNWGLTPAKAAKTAPAPKGKGKATPPAPAKKAAKPTPAAKTPPPAKAAAPVASDESIPAQGEEAPQA